MCNYENKLLRRKHIYYFEHSKRTGKTTFNRSIEKFDLLPYHHLCIHCMNTAEHHWNMAKLKPN